MTTTTELEKVLKAMNDHGWVATYYTYDDPMECYCGARMGEHDVHLAEEILKSLNRSGQTYAYVID